LYQGTPSGVPMNGNPQRNSVPRHIQTERTFFITSVAWGHRSIFQSDRMASLLIDVLFHYQQLSKYKLHAFVVMPDHLHALLTVGPELSIERVVQFIKGGFSFRVVKELGYTGEVWQKGFSEVSITGLERFDSAQNYIHQNPVRRRLCVSEQEFRFSSGSGRYEIDDVPRRLKPLGLGAASGTPKGVP